MKPDTRIYKDLALQYYLKSVSIQEKNTGGSIFVDSYSNIGDIYYKKNNYKKAVEYYQEALKLTKKSID